MRTSACEQTLFKRPPVVLPLPQKRSIVAVGVLLGLEGTESVGQSVCHTLRKTDQTVGGLLGRQLSGPAEESAA